MAGFKMPYDDMKKLAEAEGSGRCPAGAIVIPETVVQAGTPTRREDLVPVVLAFRPELLPGIRGKFLMLRPSLAFAGIVDYLFDVQPRRTTRPITDAIIDSEGVIGVNTTASPIVLELLCTEYEMLMNIRMACADLELSEQEQETVAYLVATKFKRMDELPGVPRTNLKR